jgi:uncharacterized Rmd1/YagE family protein
LCQFVNDKRNLKIIANEHLKRKHKNQFQFVWTKFVRFHFCSKQRSRRFDERLIFYFVFSKYFIIVSNFNSSTTKEIVREIKFVRTWIIKRNRMRTRDVDLKLTTIAWFASWITYKRRLSIAKKENSIHFRTKNKLIHATISCFFFSNQ